MGQAVGVAAQVAQGVPVSSAIKNVVKDSALDALLGPTALFAGGLIGALKTMKAIVEQSGILERGMKNIASIQQITGKFETLLKSAEAATTRVKELYKFTATTPFDFHDVAEANRTLEALSNGALSGAKGMKLVGDAAAGTGQSMSEAAAKVGKLYNALRSGRSLDKVMFQMQMTGMVTDEMAAGLEQAEAAGQGFAEKWGVVTAALSRTSGGMANEMRGLTALAKRSETVSDLMAKAFSEPFLEAQAKSIETTIKATENLTPVLAQIGKDIAPLLTYFGALKNEISIATIATSGFASSLLVAWTAAKALFLGLAVGTLGSLIAGFGAVATSVSKFASTLSGAMKVAGAGADIVAGFAKATTLAADATLALQKGSILSAGALKLQAMWAQLSTRALQLNTASMAAARAGTTGFSLATYAASLGAGTLTGGLKLLGGALGTVGRVALATLGTALLNPIVAAAVAAATAYVAMTAWVDSVVALDKKYTDLVGRISTVNAKLNDQRRNLKSLQDWRDMLSDIAAELAKVNDELANPNLSNEDRGVLQDQRIALGKRISIEEKRDTGKLGLSRDEIESATNDVAEQRRTRDAANKIAQSTADDTNRARMLRESAAAKAAEAVIGRNVIKAKTGFERSDAGRAVVTNETRIAGLGDVDGRLNAAKERYAAANAAITYEMVRRPGFEDSEAEKFPTAESTKKISAAKAALKHAQDEKDTAAGLTAQNEVMRKLSDSELVKIQQKILDLKKAGLPATEALIRRQAELVLLSQTAAENERGAADDLAAAQQIDRTAELARLALSYEAAIAAAKMKGEETATLEAHKQLALLDRQIQQAEKLGNVKEAAALRIQKSTLLAGNADARTSLALGRSKNEALVDNNPRRAQALQDAADRKRLRAEYGALGLTKQQADSDFDLNIKAQAAQVQPRIVADSLQSIGGGGGSYGGDPMLAAQQRIAESNAVQEEYLRIISEAAGRPPGGTLN